MPKKVKIIIFVGLVVMLIITIILIIKSPKQYLIIDGWHNEVYSGAINTIFQEGLDHVDDETAHLANAYIEDTGANYIVLIDPPNVKTVMDFYDLARAHGAKLIIGYASNEEKLKAELFNLGFSGKKITFKTNRAWKPDGKNYFY
ncbi:MAG: hypothetical protein BWY51_00585 [Parcubacteria group bacterium ADurb.Bin316]|mgnify:CR=1 FL=1|nr:MAG: hypothetical protein BWY51_00585 [Parcubacteria group bacterium ADurb.Bin316]